MATALTILIVVWLLDGLDIIPGLLGFTTLSLLVCGLGLLIWL